MEAENWLCAKDTKPVIYGIQGTELETSCGEAGISHTSFLYCRLITLDLLSHISGAGEYYYISYVGICLYHILHSIKSIILVIGLQCKVDCLMVTPHHINLRAFLWGIKQNHRLCQDDSNVPCLIHAAPHKFFRISRPIRANLLILRLSTAVFDIKIMNYVYAQNSVKATDNIKLTALLH